MLQAAAERGVHVNIVVYKEVEKALTRRFTFMIIYICTSSNKKLFLVNSAHTKTALEALHPNIAVFRHPDHIPDGADIKNDLTHSFQNMSLDASGLSKLPGDAVKALYGTKGDTVLYWAHHEKLCLIDSKIAFMGGLDLCFGRWDTNQHSIADVHPGDLSQIVFPGQDYNDARVLDFQNVAQWEQNQVDRKATSRMGWSDISISLRGPVVEDLRKHFVDRWNYIYDSKYQNRNQARYQRLDLYRRQGGQGGQPQGNTIPPSQGPQPPQQGPPNQGQLSQEPHWQQPPAQSPQPPAGQSYYPPPPVSQGQQPPPSGTQQPQQQQWQDQSQYHNQSYYPPPPASDPPQQQPAQSYHTPPPASHEQQQQQPPPQSPWQGQQQYQQQQASYGGYNNPSGGVDHSSTGQYVPPAGPPPTQGGSNPSSQYQSAPYSSTPSAPPLSQGGNYPPSQYQNTQHSSTPSGQYGLHTSTPAQAPYFPPPPGQETQQPQTSQTRGFEEDGSRGLGGSLSGYSGDVRSGTQDFLGDVRGFGHSLRGQLAGQVHQYQDRYLTNMGKNYGNEWCQVVRSVSQWSGGMPTEHSVQDAYVGAIRNSRHFVYIENQFFITATGDKQSPVQNRIGAALVERILQAAKAGQKFKVIVVIPSVPAFAGDLRDESALGTRAIMDFQYKSINRGGNSIMELIAREGYNPMEYIRFYNLRNYDRINTNSTMLQAERTSGVNYEDARRYHDAAEVGSGGYGPGNPPGGYDTTQPYQQYQQAANAYPSTTSGRWDSVSECYMLGGQDIRNVPWDSDLPEIDAFVTEELYVHSKVCVNPISRSYR
jgi:phospholipase D1/2